MHHGCAWRALTQVARSNSIWKVLWCWRPAELNLCHWWAEQGQEWGKGCGQVSLRSRTHPFPEEIVLGASSGQNRSAAVLKPLIRLTTGGSQKDILELCWPDILLSCSFCDSKASLAKQRNSCYSGKRTQNDSPAASVITTPPVTNKLFQSYYSILGIHSLYDILPDIIWDMGTYSVRCVTTRMCFVTKSLYIGPLQILKVILKGISSKQ